MLVLTKPEAFAGRIVVVLPVRNEGIEIVHTVRDLRRQKAPGTDLRFFVVDDGSTDGCCDILKGARDITLFRNEEPQGQGRARNLGVLLNPDARGIISSDAHMRISTQYGIERMVLAAEEHGAIVGAVTRSFAQQPTERGGCGTRWAWFPEPVPGKGGRKGDRAGLWHKWVYRDEAAPVLQPVELVNGAFYAFTPRVYERMGGFIESEGLFGFFEQELSLNAWFHDMPRFVATDVNVRHLFRPSRPYTENNSGYWYNYIECLRVMFDDATWRRVFEPVLQKHVRSVKTDARMQYLLHTQRLACFHETFAASRSRTDTEALEWMRIETE